jgi:ferredoxin-NADP reductase
MELNVQSFEDFGAVRVIRLATKDKSCPSYQAGQYAVLKFADFPERPYSIANAPNGQYLEFHIKNSGQAGASDYATKHLKIGDKILCSKIDGHYTHDPSCPHPLMLIAGGTGLSPMLAITEASLSHNPARPIHLFYGGRTFDDLYYHPRLQQLAQQNSNISYTPALSEERQDGIAYGLIGDIALQHPKILKSRLYVAGPVDMVSNIINTALAKGLQPDVIHSDYKDLTGKK